MSALNAGACADGASADRGDQPGDHNNNTQAREYIQLFPEYTCLFYRTHFKGYIDVLQSSFGRYIGLLE